MTTRPRCPTESADRPIELLPDPVAALRRTLEAFPCQLFWTLARLHCPVRNDDELAELIDDVATTAREALPGAKLVGATLHADGRCFAAGGTDGRIIDVDTAQHTAEDGPGTRATRHGHLINAGPAQLYAEWPALASRARDAGVHAVLAAPLDDRANGPCGNVTFYSARATRFRDDECALLLALTGLLVRGVSECTVVTEMATHIDQLDQALANRGVIDQAKGILMAVHRVDETAAFRRLVQQSNHRNVKVRDVAAEFVAVHTAQPRPASNASIVPEGAGSVAGPGGAFGSSSTAFASVRSGPVATGQGELLSWSRRAERSIPKVEPQ